MSLVKIGGYRWSSSDVGWGSRGKQKDQELLGYQSKKPGGGRGSMKDSERELATLDFWKVDAVYALFSGSALVYVGEGKLGDRLRKHHRGVDLRGQWDRFSWLSPWDYDLTPVASGGPAKVGK